MSDPLAEIRSGFFVECDELIETLQDELAALPPENPSPEAINTIFRAVHSIKGGAGAFGYSELVAVTHRLETALDALRGGRAAMSPALLKQLFHAADLLQDLVQASRDGLEAPSGTELCLTEVERMVRQAPAPEGEEGALWIVRFRPHAELYASGNEPLFLLRALSGLGPARVTCDVSAVLPLDEIAPETPCLGWTITLPVEVPQADIREVFDFVEDLCDLSIRKATEPADMPPPTAPRDTASNTVRVDLERVDRLMNLVGELVINQAMLAQCVVEAGVQSNSALMTGLETFNSLTREIQDSVMMIRAQPVKPLFQRMARIVRETSAATGKEVRLELAGETTEVDRTVIERLAEPLTHMIRNAIDHGIETPALRRAIGKPAEGVISLSAQHRAGRLVVTLSDDGRGIDRDRVLQVAIARGLLAPDAAASPTEIDNLLFLPGFSTATEVSTLSGRGVGMDVVRQGIHALGGRMGIESEPGQGTRFIVTLPLTLAVLDGMVVTVAGETLVVPLSAISETAMLDATDLRRVAGRYVVHVRGEFLPLFDVGAELGYRPPRPPGEGIVLLTTKEDGLRAALIVDGVIEQRQVVIKGLEHALGRVPGIAAATILGDGQIALILDPPSLIQNAGKASPAHTLSLAG